MRSTQMMLAVCALLFAAGGGPAFAAQTCAPKAVGAKILKSKNASDIHPDWKPPNRIGLGWSLAEIKHEGRFLSGRLVTTRGGLTRGRVYVIADEWDCEG